jgi:hypothetical protein
MSGWELAAELAKLGIGLAQDIATGSNADDARVRHEREVSDAIKRYQMATGRTEPRIPLPIGLLDSIPPPPEE